MSFSFDTETCRPAFPGTAKPLISYGLRFPDACLRHCIETFDSSRIYILCSQSLAANTDALDRLQAALGDRVAGVRVGIRPHTPIAQVLEIARDARKLHIDGLVTLGAGSLTDAAKLVRLALANDATTEADMGTLWGHSTDDNPSRRPHIENPDAIPLIHIPTSLSGGEYQAMAGATESPGPEPSGQPESKNSSAPAKRIFDCEDARPDLILLDPELCATTPAWVWLSTGIRAVDHCVETLCSLWSEDGGARSQGDEWARRGLPKLVRGLLASHALLTKDGPSATSAAALDARHLCQLGVGEAMCAVASGTPLGASHAIGHQLGPLGVGHGQTSCILLPAVCKFNRRWGRDNADLVSRQDSVRDLLLGIGEVQVLLQSPGTTDVTGNSSSGHLDLGDVLARIIEALEMPRSLKEVGVGSELFGALARNSLDDIWIRTNAIPITKEAQVLEILDMCR